MILDSLILFGPFRLAAEDDFGVDFYQLLQIFFNIYNSSFQLRSINESIVTNHHPLLKNHHQKPRKRLTHQRERLEKHITTKS